MSHPENAPGELPDRRGSTLRIALRLLPLLALLVAAVTALQQARAGSDHYYPPVTDPIVLDECSACHMAFPPSMLPTRSWNALMDDLANHFGDDATLDPDTREHVRAYLVARASDANHPRTEGATPLRITELLRWLREHDEIPARVWKRDEVRSPANCQACHLAADRGIFDDD